MHLWLCRHGALGHGLVACGSLRMPKEDGVIEYKPSTIHIPNVTCPECWFALDVLGEASLVDVVEFNHAKIARLSERAIVDGCERPYGLGRFYGVNPASYELWEPRSFVVTSLWEPRSFVVTSEQWSQLQFGAQEVRLRRDAVDTKNAAELVWAINAPYRGRVPGFIPTPRLDGRR